jgi:Holliday junction resolvasome RuvABC ATP-dependent DNA helicase subunit
MKQVLKTKAAAKAHPLDKSVEKYFPRYIGQTDITRHLAAIIDAVLAGRPIPFPPQFFGGMAGSGKTELGMSIAKALAVQGFSFVEIPNSVTLPQFLQMWGDCVEGKQVVLFIDEAHNFANKKVMDLVKRLTETGGEIRAVRAGEAFITSNPFQHLWIAASNLDATDAALFGPTGRFKNWTLQPLSTAEIHKLAGQLADDMHVRLHKDAADYLLGTEDKAGRVMPNGRSIRKLVSDCALYAVGGTVNLELAKAIVRDTKRFPLGLEAQDVRVMNFVAPDPRGKQVGEIAAHCGGADAKVLAYAIRQLCGLGLMQTNTAGRKALSEAGVAYLEALAKAQAAAKAKKAAKVAGKGAAKADKPEAKPEAAKGAKVAAK